MASRHSQIRYRNPPLQEAICELHFDLKRPLDEDQVKKLQDCWRDDGFPDQQLVQQKHVDVRIGLQSLETKEVAADKKLVCRNKEGDQLIQLTPKLLALNHLAPYPGWTGAFRSVVLHRVEELASVLDLQGFRRTGLRYIDRIEIPQAPLEWRRWFNVELPLPDVLKRSGCGVQLRLESPLEEGLKAVTQLFSASPEKPEHSAVIFDMDVISSRFVSLADLEAELDRVHMPQVLAFEEILTDSTRKLLEPTT